MDPRERSKRQARRRASAVRRVRQDRIKAILQADLPELLTLEECFLYCRRRLGIGRTAFKRAVRPRLKTFPLYVHKGRFHHIRVRFAQLRQVVEELIEEGEAMPFSAEEIWQVRREQRRRK